jgi:steroid delta-isomerase
LAAYAAKDLDAVGRLLAEDVRLRDWKISVRGKTAALDETRRNFAAAESISIEILRLHASGPTVAAELRIEVDEHNVLYVIDVLDFDAAGCITAIRAFLGRGD